MPPFDVLTIVDSSHGDDRLYPTLSPDEDEYPVELTGGDGEIAHFKAERVLVHEMTPGGRLSRVMPAPSNLKWDVLITDSRVVVYCTRFDKGGGWIGVGGGAIIAVAANAVSMALAAHRRKGKLLVGQVRYQWLATVGASPKNGWRTSETVRLKVDAQPGGQDHRYVYLTLALLPDFDATAVAHMISQRCARFRLLSAASMQEEERASFEAIAHGPKQELVLDESADRFWSWYQMPTSYRVNALTARSTPTYVRPNVETRSRSQGAARPDEGGDAGIAPGTDAEGAEPGRRAHPARIFDPVYGGSATWDETAEADFDAGPSGAPRPRRTFDPVYGRGESWDEDSGADREVGKRGKRRRSRAVDPVYGGAGTWDDASATDPDGE